MASSTIDEKSIPSDIASKLEYCRMYIMCANIIYIFMTVSMTSTIGTWESFKVTCFIGSSAVIYRAIKDGLIYGKQFEGNSERQVNSTAANPQASTTTTGVRG
eukprot:CAMPEP_0115014534 /NCGR_PEP_ID=MMETSP0216-20121206/26147_1 /TAXON_ID=223996 /ORGANISM="Protocruzia adherens, Strain Boccale" /LENGTH=102 /DNA_ID=CAMNT_0002384315 /DNA_START=139 /DNA_END=447 /DNA_ORIENTATION=+